LAWGETDKNGLSHFPASLLGHDAPSSFGWAHFGLVWAHFEPKLAEIGLQLSRALE